MKAVNTYPKGGYKLTTYPIFTSCHFQILTLTYFYLNQGLHGSFTKE